jgi:hypothetical protein
MVSYLLFVYVIMLSISNIMYWVSNDGMINGYGIEMDVEESGSGLI